MSILISSVVHLNCLFLPWFVEQISSAYWHETHSVHVRDMWVLCVGEGSRETVLGINVCCDCS